MINVVQEIVDKLRTVYPPAQYDIYTERIEQGFSAPCFSIRQLRADVTPYPSGLHEIVQHMDVRFFPSAAVRRSNAERPRRRSRCCCGARKACAGAISRGKLQTRCCISSRTTGNLSGKSRKIFRWRICRQP